MLWFMWLQGVGHDLVSKNNNKELVSSDPQKSNLTFLRETMALIIASGMLGKSFNMCTSEFFFFFQNLSSKETHLGIRQILIQIRPLFSRPRVIFLL